jgi:phage-related protein
MPPTIVKYYRDNVDSVPPLIDWLEALPPKARTKCLAGLTRLESEGHDLRRPAADYLRDGIYGLRVGLQGVNYRLLYFFHGREAVVVSHGLTKEREVPPREIDLAIQRKARLETDPRRHSFP